MKLNLERIRINQYAGQRIRTFDYLRNKCLRRKVVLTLQIGPHRSSNIAMDTFSKCIIKLGSTDGSFGGP